MTMTDDEVLELLQQVFGPSARLADYEDVIEESDKFSDMIFGKGLKAAKSIIREEYYGTVEETLGRDQLKVTSATPITWRALAKELWEKGYELDEEELDDLLDKMLETDLACKFSSLAMMAKAIQDRDTTIANLKHAIAIMEDK